MLQRDDSPYRLPDDTAGLLGFDRIHEPWTIDNKDGEKLLASLSTPRHLAQAMLRSPRAALRLFKHLHTRLVIGTLRAVQREMLFNKFRLPLIDDDPSRLHRARLDLTYQRGQIARISRYDLILAMLMANTTTDIHGNTVEEYR